MSDSSSCSGDSDSFSEGDSEEILEHLDPDVSILPYQFEPEIEDAQDRLSEDSEDSDSDNSDQEHNRLQNCNW
jgi:hypothetical protein